MDYVYTLREFRSKTKEAFDKAHNGSVKIKRGKEIYILMYSSLEGQYPNRPEDEEVVFEVPSAWTFCKHGADPKFCKHAKKGKC